MPNSRNHEIDRSSRRCGCGKLFRISDYPPGYLAYKKQVRPGSTANVCPSCEADILRNTVKMFRKDLENESLTLTRKERTKHEGTIERLEQDIELLVSGELQCDRHRRNARRVYGLPV